MRDVCTQAKAALPFGPFALALPRPGFQALDKQELSPNYPWGRERLLLSPVEKQTMDTSCREQSRQRTFGARWPPSSTIAHFPLTRNEAHTCIYLLLTEASQLTGTLQQVCALGEHGEILDFCTCVTVKIKVLIAFQKVPSSPCLTSCPLTSSDPTYGAFCCHLWPWQENGNMSVKFHITWKNN